MSLKDDIRQKQAEEAARAPWASESERAALSASLDRALSEMASDIAEYLVADGQPAQSICYVHSSRSRKKLFGGGGEWVDEYTDAFVGWYFAPFRVYITASGQLLDARGERFPPPETRFQMGSHSSPGTPRLQAHAELHRDVSSDYCLYEGTQVTLFADEDPVLQGFDPHSISSADSRHAPLDLHDWLVHHLPQGDWRENISKAIRC